MKSIVLESPGAFKERDVLKCRSGAAVLLGSEDKSSGGPALALEGLRDWVSVESNGDGKVAGPVMCSLRLWRLVAPLASLETTRNDERVAGMVSKRVDSGGGVD